MVAKDYDHQQIGLNNEEQDDGDREIELEETIASLLSEREADAQLIEALQAQIEKLSFQLSKKEQPDETKVTEECVSEKDKPPKEHSMGDLKYIADLESQATRQLDIIEENDRTINELAESIAALKTSQSNQIKSLEEKLKDAERQVSRLSKVENIAERYKRKLQDSKDLERQIEYLENENESLRLKIVDYESPFEPPLPQSPSTPKAPSRVLRRDPNTPEPPRSSQHRDRAMIQGRIISYGQKDQSDESQRVANSTLYGEQNGIGVPQNIPAAKIEEIELLIQSQDNARLLQEYSLLHNERENLSMELKLMSSAWYSLASRVQQQNVVIMKKVNESPKGWLLKQRQVLNRIR